MEIKHQAAQNVKYIMSVYTVYVNVGLYTEKRAGKPSEMRLHYWLMFMSRDLVHHVTLLRK